MTSPIPPKKEGKPSTGFRSGTRQKSLHNIPCFRGLDAAGLESMQTLAREKALRRGEILFQEGAVCDEIFVITQGSVKVYRLSDDGRQHTLWVLGAGDCFCLAPFFHRTRYPVTAQCTTEVRILRLERESWPPLLGGNPGLACGVAQCLCERLAALASHLEIVSTREVRRRLARILSDLARRRGVRRPEGTLLDSGLTHDELAACVGTAREVISRTLGQFQQEGLVTLGRRRLLIRDLPGLQAASLPRRPSKDARR